MLEQETMKCWKKMLIVSAVYLIVGVILTRSFILSGGFLADSLSGFFINYSHPGWHFISLLLFSVIVIGGALSNIWSNEDWFEKYENDLDMKMRLMTIAHIMLQATLVIGGLFLLAVLDISVAWFSK